MKYDQQYIEQLENLVATLLPYYEKYHILVKKDVPYIAIPEHIKPKKPLPALLRGDFRFVPRTGESQETTKKS